MKSSGSEEIEDEIVEQFILTFHDTAKYDVEYSTMHIMCGSRCSLT
jgi:hypothetical protein